MQDERKESGNEAKKASFTFVDYWFHFGIIINIIVVFLLLWYSIS